MDLRKIAFIDLEGLVTASDEVSHYCYYSILCRVLKFCLDAKAAGDKLAKEASKAGLASLSFAYLLA